MTVAIVYDGGGYLRMFGEPPLSAHVGLEAAPHEELGELVITLARRPVTLCRLCASDLLTALTAALATLDARELYGGPPPC